MFEKGKPRLNSLSVLNADKISSYKLSNKDFNKYSSFLSTGNDNQ